MSSPQLNVALCCYLKYLAEECGEFDKTAVELALSCCQEALKVPASVSASKYLKDVFDAGATLVETPSPVAEIGAAREEAVAQANRLKDEGSEFFKNGNYQGAISKYSEAIALAPSAPLFSNRALCYIKIQDYAKAEADARSAIRVDAKFARGYSRLAAALEAQGRLDDAVEALRGGVAVAPELQGELKAYEAKKPAAAMPPGGMPNIPGLSELMQDPEMLELMKSPKFMQLMDAVKTGGIGAAMPYMSDPEIAPVIQKLMGKLMGNGGMANMASMFGGAHI